MTATTMKSFAQSSGKLAGNKKGNFLGKLLGKDADGLEALQAFAALAAGKFNMFMELAQAAVKTYAKKLETLKTIPFANPDVDFNPTLNPQKAAMRKAPALGLGSSSVVKKQKPSESEKEDK